MSKVLLALRSFWDVLPAVLIAVAGAFVAGVWVQGKHSAAVCNDRVNQLKAEHLQEALDHAAQRDRDRQEFLDRLNKQREQSNAKYADAVRRHSDFVAELERMRAAEADKALYLRATADSAAARAATAERLFGVCTREHHELARRASVHTLDLRDAMMR